MSTTTSINTIENTNNNSTITTTTNNNATTSTNFTIKANLENTANPADEEAISSITDKPSDSTTKSIKDNEVVESPSNLSFTKKDLSKSRTQSFQSVLSTASLKSLHQQALTNPIINNSNNTNASNTPSHGLTRNNSTISQHNNLSINSSKISNLSFKPRCCHVFRKIMMIVKLVNNNHLMINLQKQESPQIQMLQLKVMMMMKI